MKITKDMTAYKVISRYPHLKEVFIEFGFKSITDPFKFNTVAKIMTLENACRMKSADLDDFLKKLNSAVDNGDEKSTIMAQLLEIDQARAEKIGIIISSFFDGADIKTLRQEYDLIAPVTPAEFAYAEQLISDTGVTDDSIQTHLDGLISIFRSSLDAKPEDNLPEGHPISIFIKENAEITKLITAAKNEQDTGKLLNLFNKLKDINIHFVRKETQLFPLLEKKGFDKPSTIMWSLHDKIRDGIKTTIKELETGRVAETANLLDEMEGMVFKEEKILFPTALAMISDNEWRQMKKGEKELGYCFIENIDDWDSDKQINTAPADLNGLAKLGEGTLSLEQLDAILRLLPFDISFVDENDRVKFYNDAPHRIFPRSPEVIGREVRFCHPPKSVDTVMEILNTFKSGTKNQAEFWLTLHGRFLHISYFAVRNTEGKYIGTLEVMQDATNVRKLEGARTLLSWDK